jgi:ferredoxin
MPYLEELLVTYPDRIVVWASGDRGQRADLAQLVDSSAEVYACGSASVLDELSRVVPVSRLHLERFTPQDRSAEHRASAIQVVWAPTGQSLSVSAKETVLDGLERAGIDVNASCRRGVCGSCELRVVDGTPAHLDSVMSDADKDEMGIFYPCVSRSLTPTLTLAP